jgi:hypothetical protein
MKRCSAMLELTRYSGSNDRTILINMSARDDPKRIRGSALLTREMRNVARYRETMITITFRIGGYSCCSVASVVVGGSSSAFSTSSEGDRSMLAFSSSRSSFDLAVESSKAMLD